MLLSSGTATILEPARELPVRRAFDVLVAGGGIAGVAAAVAAARAGVSVCLLEKTCALGGLATLGNVTVWLPLCDGCGRQVVGGLAEELLKLSVAGAKREHPDARFGLIPACWLPGGDPESRKRIRYRVDFNPASYLMALERFALDAGVALLYDTRVCAVRRQADRISHVIVENKSGRTAVACAAVVDATGDADVCFLSGEETESLDTNVLAAWFYSLLDGRVHREPLTRPFSPYATRERAEGPFFRGDDAEHVTAQILGSRQMMRDRLGALRVAHPDADVQVILPPTLPDLRMTRRLVGAVSVSERDVHRHFEDAVCLTGDWRKPGPVYAIPMRALQGRRNANLAAAGRCLSADTTAWDVTRAIPPCAATGQAAGAAAALAVLECDGRIEALPVSRLQTTLKAHGVLLDANLVAPACERPREG